ncbi:hypothetical protein [Nitrosomonas supralitoralis]|uniref:Uncharacterized protein n=1 Tax=Nitrosomonas supralitoralis TaxID=2116706 RepID=A0A2P7NR42_9PROT|nr:hypothetical protein [Nitrosomonas supralitoralis]PSJ15951.1 hypothetical protein C7H79_16230 [Nitrosomonas supralitoralis]
MKTVNYDKGIYSLNLDQSEIIMLLSGDLPYVIFVNDPEIPDDECVWIYYEPKAKDIIPPIYPFPCRVLAYEQLPNQTHILTLTPEESDLALIEKIKEFRANLKRMDEYIRPTASLPHYASV